MAIEQKKTFVIYGIDSRFTNQWMHTLEKLQIRYELMDDEEIKDWYGYHVSSVYDLPYYGIENVFVIINKQYERLPDAVALLKNYGISFESRNAISVYEYIAYQSGTKYIVDICAGPITQALALGGEYPCYRVLGSKRPDDYKLMVVGGSTSAEYLYTYKTWVELLEKKLRESGKNITIYNGAVSGYTSMQELSKMIRDIRYIKPDLVISFSGYNDRAKFELQEGYVNGMTPVDKDGLENYLLNEEMMFQIAQKFCAEFLCIMQPQICFKEYLNNYEKLIIKEIIGANESWLGVFNECEKYPWLVNMTNILNEVDVFFDSCHVTTEGNEIIAQHIYELIKDKVN